LFIDAAMHTSIHGFPKLCTVAPKDLESWLFTASVLDVQY